MRVTPLMAGNALILLLRAKIGKRRMEEKTENAQRDDAAVNAGNRAAGDNDGGGAAAEIPEAVWVLKMFGSYTMRDMRRVRPMSLYF